MTFGPLLARSRARLDLGAVSSREREVDLATTEQTRPESSQVGMHAELDGTRLWSDQALIDSEKRLASGAQLAADARPSSGLRPRPHSARVSERGSAQGKWLEQTFSRAPRVEPERVRALFDHFLHVVGPAAKPLFELELRNHGLRPSSVSERNLDALVEGLAARIPLATARARFLARAADVQVH